MCMGDDNLNFIIFNFTGQRKKILNIIIFQPVKNILPKHYQCPTKHLTVKIIKADENKSSWFSLLVERLKEKSEETSQKKWPVTCYFRSLQKVRL